MEDQETDFSVHHPPTWMALVLDLVVRPEMPLAVDLATPERIIVTCVCRPNLSRVVGTTFCCNPAVLQLDVFARRAMGCVTMSIGWPSLPQHMGGRRGISLSLAVCHMVGRCSRSLTGWVDMRCIAIAGNRVIVSPLVGVIEVSKRIQRAIQVVVVVAIATAIGGIRVTGRIVVGGVSLGAERTGVVYRRFVGTRRIPYTYTNANTVSIASLNATVCSAIGRLAGVGEDTALAISGIVDVLVTRL